MMKLKVEEIRKLHLDENLSVLEIAKRFKVSRDTIYRYGKAAGIRFRNPKQAADMKTGNKGALHWAYGLTKENSEWARSHSSRMRKDNPMHNKSSIRKAAMNRALVFRSNMMPHEKIFSEILSRYKIVFMPQYPIQSYIIDFFIPNLNLCIEIDSVRKWGVDRRHHASVKDQRLKKAGYEVLRIGKHIVLEQEQTVLSILRHNGVLSL